MVEVTYVINEFEKEVITFSTITCLRLFELGNDPTLLYLFYVKTSKIQGTKSVYALNSFCKGGLGWGDHRFNKAKKLLIENRLIEQITKKDDKGVITGHYIRIHYLKNNLDVKKPNKITTDAPTHKVDSPSEWTEPPCGWEETNTINKNTNTINKNTNTNNKKSTVTNDITDIFSEWNNNKIIVHRDLTQPIINSISRALKLFTRDKIIEAIKNYSEIVKSDLYFFSYKWSLQEFLQRGLSKQGQSNNKGFTQFLSENRPFQKFIRDKNIQEIDILLKEFTPITVSYKSRGIDISTQTYLGFRLENLNSFSLMKEYTSDIKRNYNNSCFGFGDYCYLEEVIASIFFNRKAGYDIELLKALLSIWREMKPKFKMRAAQQLED